MNTQLLRRFAWPWRGRLALCSLVLLGETLVALALPWLGGQFAGGLFTGALAGLGWLIPALLGLLAVQALLRFVSGWMLETTAHGLLADLRARLYDHLQALPLGYFQQRRHGEVLALLTHDVEHLSQFISGTLLQVLPLVLSLTGAVVLMAAIDWRLTLAVGLMVPVFFLLMKVLGRRLRPLSRQLQQAEAEAVGVAEENLSMLPAIKTFTREGRESARYGGQVAHILGLRRQQALIHNALGPLVQFLAAAGMVLVLWWLGSASADRSPAEMVSFLLYTAMLTGPVSTLADVYGQIRQASGALERLDDVMHEPAEPSGGPALPPLRGEITLEDVGFAYPGRPPALTGVDLHIPAGQTVALTGHNGAGKSTLVHLLMRLMVPTKGRVLLDGVDVAGVSLQSVRSQIGVVQQQVLLFNGTVQENIAWGKPDADRAAVVVAAQAAQAHAFIEALPQGYDTPIGDQGVRLSGGQRQRIALARALLKDPPILVLDEATAMFDPESERSFIADCHDTLKHRTVLLITHRPASLALADRVLRLEGGRLLFEKGEPNEQEDRNHP